MQMICERTHENILKQDARQIFSKTTGNAWKYIGTKDQY